MLTAADVVITLQQPILFPIPRQIQGFATDDVYDIPAVKMVETQMGVDGVLSAGFVNVEVTQTFVLQADSESNDVFDTIALFQQSGNTAYELFGMTILPSLGTKFVMTRGFLTSWPPAPAAKRILQPRRYEITWQRIAPVPA